MDPPDFVGVVKDDLLVTEIADDVDGSLVETTADNASLSDTFEEGVGVTTAD